MKTDFFVEVSRLLSTYSILQCIILYLHNAKSIVDS